MRLLALVFILVFSPLLIAGEKTETEIQRQLEDFLTGASIHSAKAHNKFWHPDLIYTSSGGERFGKSSIINALQDPDTDDINPDDLPQYSAQDIQVKPLSESVAVLTFKLVSTDKKGKSYYYNSGVFVKEGSQWQAINWQATKIP
ncbi:hypothetical protein HMF8227_02983 [Saliniradius amylolyticus]|uniref:DUF4440 domain-containing protein n=1 Tax=Saliniradius amylolyticus TaxID=2183582 RepID=A0A2S2E700_9ALTE|nr:nuclear transport factor 2 family protein [Saliniradius amylolyticus]AWL13431.1 hypothetical protein HMF8227_02983 [Saliniradius amylolyticus]